MKEKTPLLLKCVCFHQMPIKGFRPVVLYYFSEKLPLSQKLLTSEGVVSQNVLYYYQQLSTACYQVSFEAYNYFKVTMLCQ